MSINILLNILLKILFSIRLILVFGVIVLQASCSNLPEHTVPVEDKSLQTRNPYAAVLPERVEEDKPYNLNQKVPNQVKAHNSSLRLEEIPEEIPENNNFSNPNPNFKSNSNFPHATSLWLWPTDNPIARQDARGIDFSGKVGDAIRAVKSGKVVFSGSGLKGYGQLIIIKHEKNLLTAYAHNHNLLVKEGDLVDTGQVIAEMGLDQKTNTPVLHFEVRLNGKSVDPLRYLPGRIS